MTTPSAAGAGRARYRLPIFLSYPKPLLSSQVKFVDAVGEYLMQRGFAPRTLGVTDYDMDAPLVAIRRMMYESHGLITIAFRRSQFDTLTTNPSPDMGLIRFQGVVAV